MNYLKIKFTKIYISRQVIEAKECVEDATTPIEKALAILSLLENENHEKIMPMQIEDCDYEIINVSPTIYFGEF